MKNVLLGLILALICLGSSDPSRATEITLVYTGKTWGEVAPCYT
ncbi:hypothetical protein [Thermosulfuriphilus sp.]